MDRRVVPIHSRAVPIIASGTSANPVVQLLDRGPKNDPPNVPSDTESEPGRTYDPDFLAEGIHNPFIHSRKAHAAQARTIPAFTQMRLLVRSSAPGLVAIEPGGKLSKTNAVRAANGIADIAPGRPLFIYMANLENYPVHIPKHSVVARAVPQVAPIVHIPAAPPETTVALTAEAPNDAGTTSAKEGATPSNSDTSTGDDEDKDPVPKWHSQVSIGERAEVERPRILEFLDPFQSMWDGHLGEIHHVKHRIELKEGAKPVFQPPYRAGPDKREKERAEIQKMLDMDVIEEAECEWASPVVFAPKPDGTLRFCVDYRRLNAMTVRDSYPIPRMDECIDSLGDANVFTTLDANCGYWQIEIDEDDRDKTAFTSHWGLFRFKRMPFGLKNAPGTFQRAADVILSKVKWQTALVYLDDVIVYSKTYEEHFEHLRTVLDLLKNAGVSLKLKKCHFFQKSCDYLGHKIGPGKLEVAQKCRDAIRKAIPPKNVSELRSFLGLCNVYRRFVEAFARKAAPLTKKLQKDQPFDFGELTLEETEAYEQLRDSMISPPVLALPKAGKTYVLDTDACNYQLGCVLMQEQDDGSHRPIGYWSRSLTKAEKNYSTTEKECLAIVWAVLTLRPYLEGNRFTLRTDHHSLRWIMNLADASGRLQRWRLRLADFEYDIVHRAGVKHQAADALSRLPTNGTDQHPLDDGIPTLAIGDSETFDPYDWAEGVLSVEEEVLAGVEDIALDACLIHGGEQPPLPGIPDVLALDEHSTPPGEVTMSALREAQANDRYCKHIRASLDIPGTPFGVTHQDILVRRSPLDGSLQKVVPFSLIPTVLYNAHYPVHAGHPGGTRMYETIRKEYYWRSMANDIFQAAKDCRSCAKVRGTRGNKQHLMELFPAVDPLAFVAMDIVGPFVKTQNGHTNVLVITDRFSKIARAIPLKKTTAAEVAAAFLENWICPYGMPEYLLTDNGPQFVARTFEFLTVMLGVVHVRTTAYHPQTNGQAERYNRTLVTRLVHYVSEHQNDWDQYVQPLTYAYNSQVHRTTGFTPFELVLNKAPKTPLDVYVDIADDLVRPASRRLTDKNDDTANAKEEARRLRLRLRAMIDKARRNSSVAQERYKRNSDRRVRFRVTVQEGDYVYLTRPPSSARTVAEQLADIQHSKLRPKTTAEAYKVLKADRNTVTIDTNGIPDTVSIDRVTVRPAPNPRTDGPEPPLPRRWTRRRSIQDPYGPVPRTNETDVPPPAILGTPVPVEDDEPYLPPALDTRPERTGTQPTSSSTSENPKPPESVEADAQAPPSPTEPPKSAAERTSVAPHQPPSGPGRSARMNSTERTVSADPGPVPDSPTSPTFTTPVRTDERDTLRDRPTGVPVAQNGDAPHGHREPIGRSGERYTTSSPGARSSLCHRPTWPVGGPSETRPQDDTGVRAPAPARPSATSEPSPGPSTLSNVPASSPTPPTAPTTVPAVLDRILGHIDEPGKPVQYICRWFGSDAGGDTEEPAHHLPAATVARYWAALQRRGTAPLRQRSASPPSRQRTSSADLPRRSSRIRRRS